MKKTANFESLFFIGKIFLQDFFISGFESLGRSMQKS